MNNLSVVNHKVVTMSSLDLAEMLGYKKKEINKKIRSMFGEDIARETFSPAIDNQGRVEFYSLPELESKMFVAKHNMVYLEQITQFWIDHKPQVPATYIEALKALVVSEEEKQIAISTKAEIGHRREATSMNTASQAVKKANKLEIKLDLSKEYSSIKRMEIITGDKFNWRLLKSTSISLEKVIKKVPDSNYEEVNSYHYTVWQEAYGLEIV